MFASCPQFIVIEFCVFVYVREKLDVFEGELESYTASVNQTGTLAPVVLQVKELMNVSKGKPTLAHSCCLTAGGSPPPKLAIRSSVEFYKGGSYYNVYMP